MSEANETLGNENNQSVAEGDEQMLLAFSEPFIWELSLGIRSFHSLLPRLYKLVAVGDFVFVTDLDWHS